MNPLQKIAEFVVAELDHFQAKFRPEGGALGFAAQMQLQNEPFVGYARVVDEKRHDSRLLICRHYIPSSFKPSHADAEYASYLAPFGQIIVKKPGEHDAFEVRHRRTGLLLESHSFELGKRRISFAPDGGALGRVGESNCVGQRVLTTAL